jgi:hypothetical protein
LFFFKGVRMGFRSTPPLGRLPLIVLRYWTLSCSAHAAMSGNESWRQCRSEEYVNKGRAVNVFSDFHRFSFSQFQVNY